MTKRKTCDIQNGIHSFNGESPFGWQKCHCGVYTLGEIKDKVKERQLEKRRIEEAEEEREAVLNAK